VSAPRSTRFRILGSLLAAGRTLRPTGNSELSALPVGDAGARYDRWAALYDRVVSARANNRVVLGTSTAAIAHARCSSSGSRSSELEPPPSCWWPIGVQGQRLTVCAAVVIVAGQAVLSASYHVRRSGSTT
jgi:hypothetical protein